MNYRGKDTLAEALKNGLLSKREKKAKPVTEVVNIAEEQSRFEASIAKPTPKDIGSVAGALKPNRAPWAQKLYEENKPAPKVIVEQAEAPKKKTIQELAKTVRLNKVEEKSLILNESTDSISSVLTERAKRMWRPAKTESLEEKVSRLEAEISKKKLVETVSAERAKEILDAAKKNSITGAETRPHMQHHEIEHVKKVWKKLPGTYSFNRTLRHIAGLKEEVETLNEETAPKHKFSKVLASHGYQYKGTHTEKSLGGRQHDFPSHTYEHPTTGGKVHVWKHSDGTENWHSRNKQKNGITAPGAGDTKGQLDRHLTKWKAYHGGIKESIELVEDVSRNRHNVHLEYDDAKGQRQKQIIEIRGKSNHADAAHAARSHYKATDKGSNFHVKKVYSVNTSREGDVSFGHPVTDGVNGTVDNVKSKVSSTVQKPKSFWGSFKKKVGMSEEVVPLEELSRGTVGKYMRKAMQSKDQSHKNIDDARDKINHFEKGAGTIYNHMDVMQTSAYHNNQVKKNQNNIKKRTKGLDNAVKRLTKEEVEPINELSAQTVDSYRNKAWRSQANGHIDKGGAEYIEDKKALENANKTIAKRAKGLSLAKKLLGRK